MTLSFVLFLFLAHLGIGIVFTLVLVSRVAGVKFFRFNAGFAAALGKPLITLHDQDLTPPLKEVDAAARATAQTPEQIVEILQYLLTQQ